VCTVRHQDPSSRRCIHSQLAHCSPQVCSSLSSTPGRHLLWHRLSLNIDLLDSWCMLHLLSQSSTCLPHILCTFFRQDPSSLRCKCNMFAPCSLLARRSLWGTLGTHLKWHQSLWSIDLLSSWCTQHPPSQSCTCPRYTQYTCFRQDLSSQRRKYSLSARRSCRRVRVCRTCLAYI